MKLPGNSWAILIATLSSAFNYDILLKKVYVRFFSKQRRI